MFVPSLPTVMETGWPLALLICSETPGSTLVNVLEDDVTRTAALPPPELEALVLPSASTASWPRDISCNDMPLICEASTIMLPARPDCVAVSERRYGLLELSVIIPADRPPPSLLTSF